MKNLKQKQQLRTHPPPSSFSTKSLTTPTQRCWICGGGQVPEDGGGWEIEREDRYYGYIFFGYGKGNIISQSHLKVALPDDKAVTSFGCRAGSSFDFVRKLRRLKLSLAESALPGTLNPFQKEV